MIPFVGRSNIQNVFLPLGKSVQDTKMEPDRIIYMILYLHVVSIIFNRILAMPLGFMTLIIVRVQNISLKNLAYAYIRKYGHEHGLSGSQQSG